MLLAALTALVALGALAVPAAAAPIKLGVYDAAPGQVGAPEDAAVLDGWATTVGRRPDIVMDYSNIVDPLLTSTEVENLHARDETPLITWQLYQSGWSGPTIPLQDVAAGEYDSYLRQAADAARSMPFGEILIRFAHEMNGTWYDWSGNPTAYVAAWRHVVAVFRQEGATNVKFVWSPNVDYGSYPFAAYYPGDAWVDYVALDGYNWGDTGQGPGNWQSLYSVFGPSYDQLTQLSSKPVMIAETSSSEVGGNKAAWIREGFLHTIPDRFPRVVAVVWFNRDQEEDWRVESSLASLDAYREVVASTLFGGTVPPPEEGLAVDELQVTPQAQPPAGAPSTGSPSPAGSPAPPASSSPVLPAQGPTAKHREKRHRKHRGRRKRRVVRAHGKVVYRLSQRAVAVRLIARGPGLNGARGRRRLTLRSPRHRGRIRLARLTGRWLLRNRHYRVVAFAIGAGGYVSRPRSTSFRAVPSEAQRRSRRVALRAHRRA